MTTYVPILKAKPGGFEAFGSLSPQALKCVTPIFEICPEADVEKSVRNAVAKGIRYLPAGSRIAIDASHVPQATPQPYLGNQTIPEWLVTGLGAAGVTVIPVCPLDDPIAQQHLGGALAQHSRRAIIRVPARLVGDLRQFATELQAAAVRVGLPENRIHVLLDFFAVRASSEMTALTTHALALLGATASAGQWGSVVVAGGAFPRSVSAMPTGTCTAVQRLDAHLWRMITHAGSTIDFGDYGVNAPEMSSGGRGPLPNLRYLYDRDWLVWRESKARPGNESFYDLSQRVIAHPAWSGSSFSWGDLQIERSAAELRGAGTATQWRAYGTSHHIEGVVSRLATLGEP